MARTRKSKVPESADILAQEAPVESVPGDTDVAEAETLLEPETATDTQPDASPEEAAQAEGLTETDKSAEDDEKIHLSLSLPKAMFDQSLGAINRLKYAVGAKQTLLKKALATDSLEIMIEEDRVVFPWFTLSSEDNAEEIDAYSKLVFALAKKAITQKRVNPDEKINPDERLGMRLYLINLGFIGDEYKSARAILMRNFSMSNISRTKNEADFHMEMPEVYKP